MRSLSVLFGFTEPRARTAIPWRVLIAGVLDLDQSLADLAAARPIFHSEADFQLALGLVVGRLAPDLAVRLETRPAAGVHLDVEVRNPVTGATTAVELKYLTRSVTVDAPGETFVLRTHSARDHRRYDVLKDVSRVEAYVANRPGANGAVIVLSNDPGYWADPGSTIANDSAFRIGDGRVLEPNRYAWRAKPPGNERSSEIELRGRYAIRWRDYSEHLRALSIEVPAVG